MDAGALLDLLGNENRRRILRLLSRKPCYVTEISEHLGVSPKAVIDHLRRLESAGLIESRTDDQRRKYFHIAQHLRLEVTVAPYGFGMKSAYPASPSLDIGRCQHLSIEIERPDTPDRTEATNGGVDHGDAGDAHLPTADPATPATEPDSTDPPDTTDDSTDHPDELAALARRLDELEEIERELSLAQRWVQGRMAAVIDQLSDAIDEHPDEDYLDAAILISVILEGPQTVQEIANEVEVPPSLVGERLDILERQDIVREGPDGWLLG
ncbi:MAG: metalloregulator ArsR/SmtB family transcription factor [Halobacteriales archaeon]|nr:metalloregulator ArsR/SmtB family transcription factor [Halobacteriales archaeon]